jgi:hypothetical protein
MTGTGTQADPYIVDTWADFVTAVGKSDVYVECAEGTVWDMNDIAPDGISSRINIYAKSINGNGVIIKKLYFTSNASFFFANSTSVTGVDFLDSLVESGTFIYRSGSATFQECRFSGIIQDSIFFYNTANSSAYIKRSSINLQFQGNSLFCNGHYAGGIGGRGLNLSFCNVSFSGKSANSSAITNYSQANKYNLVGFDNCLVSGTNPFKFLYVCWDSTYSNYNIGSNYSVFDIIFESGQIITNAPNRIYSTTNCLINSDKLNGAEVLSAFTRVTDDQLHDATYLQSIGFPIGVE